jgi:hypothetical protein
MPFFQKTIEKYGFSYHSGNPDLEARFFCQHEDGQGSVIEFFKSVVPPNKFLSGGGGVSIHYPIAYFNDIISLLRYEKPIMLFPNDADLIGGVTSAGTHEPVGEQEGV